MVAQFIGPPFLVSKELLRTLSFIQPFFWTELAHFRATVGSFKASLWNKIIGWPLLVPVEPTVFTTPSSSRPSDVSMKSSTSRPFFAEDWEQVVAAAELAESMMSPPKIALFEADWEEAVAAAELAESLFLSKLK
jgi:hypothetical protein